MNFYMPTKIYCEENCVINHASELSALGTRALIVTGKHSAIASGALADIEAALFQNHIPYDIFDKIEENPSIETVMEGRNFGIDKKADFVIGVGGGSPMDAAKAIALMMKQKEKNADYLYKKGSDEAYPVAAVPTTCGTGSEATPFAILTIHAKRTKSSLPHKIFPVLALTDPKYLKSMSKKILTYTTIDALGHLIESFINQNASLYSRMLCREGLRIFGRIKGILLEEQAKDRSYEDLMNASTIAGMAISHTGTSLPHGLSYFLTYEMGIPHGRAVGYFLPGYVEAAEDTYKEEVLRLTGFRDETKLREYIGEVLEAEVLSREISPSLRAEAVTGIIQNPAKLGNCPFSVKLEVLEHMFF